MEQQLHPQNHTEPESSVSAKVFEFPAPGAPHPKRREEPPASDEEIREYRKNRARMVKMLDEWDAFKVQWQVVSTQCPVASRLLQPD